MRSWIDSGDHARERPDALVVAGGVFFGSRRVQIATLAARDRIPAAYSGRDTVEVGGLMSYATDLADTLHQVGVYTGNILKGAKPADLPVVQSTKFELVINLQTARLLGKRFKYAANRSQLSMWLLCDAGPNLRAVMSSIMR
jgi:ABC-type uncharacterized transport system substrate-binding protein